MKPLVSIITPSYNQGRFIEETIQSVLSQDYPNVEYLVIDGGSTDQTVDILRKYEGRLRWISEADKGQSDAINKGFRMAQGEIVAWLNSDDTYQSGAVGKAVDYLVAHPDVMMVYGEGYLIDERSQVKQRFPATEPFNLWRLIYHGDYILQQASFMRKAIFTEIGMLDESLHYGMDWDLFIRIGKRFKVDYIPDYLGNLREHPAAKTSVGSLKRFDELVKVMRRHGDRRFPPAYFNYGWRPYQERAVEKIRQALPWANWQWLSRAGDCLRKLVAYLIFKRVTRLSQPSPFADGWLSDRASFLFSNAEGKQMLHLVGSTRHVPNEALPLKIRIRVNGRLIQRKTVGRREEFQIDYPIPRIVNGSSMVEVSLSSNKSFVPSRFGIKDHRRLAFQLKEISLI